MKGLIKRQSTDIVEYNLEDYAGDGVDDFTPHDLPRPSLKLCQSLSPFVIKQDDKYIEGCEPGMIANSGTREYWPADVDQITDGGVVVIPIKFLNREIEWLPNRGGFVAEHLPGSFSTQDIEIKETSDGRIIREIKSNGNILVDTATYHCFLLNEDGTYSEIVVDMSSSQWQCAKDWNAFMRGIKKPSQKYKGKFFSAPIYLNVYRLFSKVTHRDANTWFLWKFKHIQELDLKNVAHQTLFQNAMDYKKLIESGQVEVDRDED
jgi:hypothetical protein